MRKAVFVSALAAAAIGTALAAGPRSSVTRDFPIYANGGKPDLTPDKQRFESQMEIVDRYFAPDDCSLVEGSVGGTGYRRLLRFDTVLMNRGDGDVVIGDPSADDNPYHEWFEFSECHQHYHLLLSTNYELLNLDGTIAATGHKQSFCFEDSLRYDGNKSNGYTCTDQGITSGWGDWYYKQLDGQWIDITGVPAGNYIARLTVNYGGMVDEGENRYSNTVETAVTIPSPRKKVDIVSAAPSAAEHVCLAAASR